VRRRKKDAARSLTAKRGGGDSWQPAAISQATVDQYNEISRRGMAARSAKGSSKISAAPGATWWADVCLQKKRRQHPASLAC